MQLSSRATVNCQSLDVVVARLTPGSTLPAPVVHNHHFSELVFFEAGEGCQRVGARVFHVTAGDLLLVAPWEVHDVGNSDTTTKWIVAFEAAALDLNWTDRDISPGVPDDLFLTTFLQLPNSNERSLRVEPAQRPQWVARLNDLAAELRAREVGCHLAAQALLHLLLVDVARLARLRLGGGSQQIRPVLLGVFSYIERRFCTPIGLADVAKAVARSPSYLTDLVKRETGRTVLQWIIYRRMAEARRLLLDASVRVKDVAPRIGYDDPGHFIRQFRRANGSTPQQWRLASQLRTDL